METPDPKTLDTPALASHLRECIEEAVQPYMGAENEDTEALHLLACAEELEARAGVTPPAEKPSPRVAPSDPCEGDEPDKPEENPINTALSAVKGKPVKGKPMESVDAPEVELTEPAEDSPAQVPVEKPRKSRLKFPPK